MDDKAKRIHMHFEELKLVLNGGPIYKRRILRAPISNESGIHIQAKVGM
jgi:hypothetical protein